MASYAAEIKEKLGFEPTLTKGKIGQFDVVVDERTVVSRKGGLLAMIMRKPWPSHDDVVAAVAEAKDSAGNRN